MRTMLQSPAACCSRGRRRRRAGPDHCHRSTAGRLCSAGRDSIKSATLTESQAIAVIRAAMNIAEPHPLTYYIIHATEFTVRGATVTEERWYVYHSGWVNRTSLNWFADYRRAKRFAETRVIGSERVSLVYVYLNVPTYTTASSRTVIAEHFRRARSTETRRGRGRVRARAALLARLRALTSQEEQRATAAASAPPPAGTTPWRIGNSS